MKNQLNVYASIYKSFGLNLACGSNILSEFNFYANNRLKCPYHKWVNLIDNEQDSKDLENFDWSSVLTIGAITGFQNLLSIDIDDCTDNSFLDQFLSALGIDCDYEWVIRTGSGIGFQILIFIEPDWIIPEYPDGCSYAPNDEFCNAFSKLEILRNCYAVLPPSIHTGGNHYEFINCLFPSTKPKSVNKFRFRDTLYAFVNSEGHQFGSFGLVPLLNPVNTLNVPDRFKFTFKDFPEKKFYIVINVQSEEQQENVSQLTLIRITWDVIDGDGFRYKRKCEIVKSGSSSPKSANMNDSDIINQLGVDIKDILTELWLDLKYVKGIISHNLDFQLDIIKYYFNSIGISFDFSKILNICTMINGGYYYQESNHSLNGPNNKNSKPIFLPELIDLYNKLYQSSLTEIKNIIHQTHIISKCFVGLRRKRVIGYYIDPENPLKGYSSEF